MEILFLGQNQSRLPGKEVVAQVQGSQSSSYLLDPTEIILIQL